MEVLVVGQGVDQGCGAGPREVEDGDMNWAMPVFSRGTVTPTVG